MDIKDVRCFIPVGGVGTRLWPLTQDVSKPCIRFLNRPLIEFALAELAEQGLRNFIFGEHGFTNYFNLFDLYGEGVGVSAKYNIEPRLHIKHQPNIDDLGSAHSFLLNMEYYEVNNHVLIVQGDNLFKFNLMNLMEEHERMNATMTIALVKVENPEQYGVADLDGKRIKRFVEKPSIGKAPSKFASSGIYFISPDLMKKTIKNKEIDKILIEKKRLDFGYDLIPYLIAEGHTVCGYTVTTWYDVGTPERYLQSMLDVLQGKMDIRVIEERILPDRNIWFQGFSQESIKRRRQHVRKFLEGKLFLEGAVLVGRHTRIGDYSKISDSCVDNFCILEDHVFIDRSGVMDGCRVGSYSHIMDSIIGRKTVIDSSHEHPTYIESNSVLGNTVTIKGGCRLIKTRVAPGLIIPQGMTYINKFLRSYEDVVQLTE